MVYLLLVVYVFLPIPYKWQAVVLAGLLTAGDLALSYYAIATGHLDTERHHIVTKVSEGSLSFPFFFSLLFFLLGVILVLGIVSLLAFTLSFYFFVLIVVIRYLPSDDCMNLLRCYRQVDKPYSVDLLCIT